MNKHFDKTYAEPPIGQYQNAVQVGAFGAIPEGAQIAAGYADSCKTAAEPTGLRIHQLQRIKARSEQEYQKSARAIDILTRHPEFEEFLELLRGGLV